MRPVSPSTSKGKRNEESLNCFVRLWGRVVDAMGPFWGTVIPQSSPESLRCSTDPAAALPASSSSDQRNSFVSPPPLTRLPFLLSCSANFLLRSFLQMTFFKRRKGEELFSRLTKRGRKELGRGGRSLSLCLVLNHSPPLSAEFRPTFFCSVPAAAVLELYKVRWFCGRRSEQGSPRKSGTDTRVLFSPLRAGWTPTSPDNSTSVFSSP